MDIEESLRIARAIVEYYEATQKGWYFTRGSITTLIPYNTTIIL
jgi:hypothetical protein